MASLVNSSKHLRKKQYQFYKLFQNTEEEGLLINSFYEVSITIYPNMKTAIKRYASITHELRCKKKKLNKILANQIQ